MLISQKRYKIETYVQWKTNRKSGKMLHKCSLDCTLAYWMAPVLVTLNDREGHSPVAGLFKCNPSNICAAFYQISADSMLAQSLSDRWASCYNWWWWYVWMFLLTKIWGFADLAIIVIYELLNCSLSVIAKSAYVFVAFTVLYNLITNYNGHMWKSIIGHVHVWVCYLSCMMIPKSLHLAW